MRDGHYIIGLTGGIASGKTGASEYLSEMGMAVVDADVISRSLTAAGGAALAQIREAFGDSVFAPDGTLNRPLLGEIVFSDTEKRRTLEAIIHPMVQKQALEEIREAQTPIVILSVPLLFETGMDVLCDEVWVMCVDRDTQIMRVMARDRLTREQAIRRIDSQMSQEARMARANVCIRSDRDVAETRGQLASLARDRLKRL